MAGTIVASYCGWTASTGDMSAYERFEVEDSVSTVICGVYAVCGSGSDLWAVPSLPLIPGHLASEWVIKTVDVVCASDCCGVDPEHEGETIVDAVSNFD